MPMAAAWRSSEEASGPERKLNPAVKPFSDKFNFIRHHKSGCNRSPRHLIKIVLSTIQWSTILLRRGQNMKKWTKSFFALAVVSPLLLPASAIAQQTATKKPNILVIWGD